MFHLRCPSRKYRQRDRSTWLRHSLEGEFVIAPAEIGGAAYYQLTYEGWTTLEQIGVDDCDDPVDELKQRAQRYLAHKELSKASRARARAQPYARPQVRSAEDL